MSPSLVSLAASFPLPMPEMQQLNVSKHADGTQYLCKEQHCLMHSTQYYLLTVSHAHTADQQLKRTDMPCTAEFAYTQLR